VQHAEDTRMTIGASMNAGPLAFRMGLRGMPVEAESSIVARDIELLRELRDEKGLDAHLHVQHISTRAALDLVRAAKRDGLHVTCEVMPHHFALNEEALTGFDTHAKMNPPLRAESDRVAMLQGLLDGTIDCIATDHAPHAPFEKQQEFERAPNGITGLETALGLCLRLLYAEHAMPLKRVLALLSTEPARVLNLGQRIPGLAKLAVGAPADIVILDPEARWTFHASASHSKARNTPFDGWAMQGLVHWTISEGRIAFARS
jgi:dihydroorotase